MVNLQRILNRFAAIETTAHLAAPDATVRTKYETSQVKVAFMIKTLEDEINRGRA